MQELLFSDEGHAKSFQKLDFAVCGVILINAATIVIEVDWGPQNPHLPLRERLGWFILESLFILVYLIELMVRMYHQGRKWTESWWNWLDFVVVLTSIVDCWLLTLLLEGDIKTLRMITFLRMVRLARLVRLVRLLRMCRGLYVMVMAFAYAMYSLVWIVFLMLIGLLMSATFTTVAIGQNKDLRHLEMRGQTTQELFGTVPRSMYTLFELMTLEDWHDLGRPLVTEKPALFFFIFGFIIIFTFGLLNMIVAMVIEKTLAFAKQQDCTAQEQAKRQLTNDLAQLKTIFLEADESGRGELELESFRNVLQRDNTIKKILQDLDIPTSDAVELFMTLDAECDGRLTVQSFLDGIAKIRGAQTKTWDEMATHAGVRLLVRKAVNECGSHARLLHTPRLTVSRNMSRTSVAEEPKEDAASSVGFTCPGTVGVISSHERRGSLDDGGLSKVLKQLEAQEELQTRRHSQVLQRLESLEKSVQQLQTAHR